MERKIMTDEQRELVKDGRRTAQSLYEMRIGGKWDISADEDMLVAVAHKIDIMCDELEGCDSDKSFKEHFIVSAGGSCWWSKD